MIKIIGIDNIGIAVKDVRLVAGFFQSTFGAEVDYPSADSARVSLGGQSLALFATDEGLATRAPNGAGLDHVTFRVEDVDDLYQRDDLAWESGPESLPDWGIRVLGLHDPEGNLYSLASATAEPLS
jgi:methylmalonyl-CoA/ethylmalonyl-CoA epimerase